MSILRYNPNFNEGLRNEQVEERKLSGLVNYNDQPPTKTISEIVKSNFFTYFNFIQIFIFIQYIFWTYCHDSPLI